MATFYLDTSAIVKRYRAEPGTVAVNDLFDNRSSDDTLYSSTVAVLEFTSAIVRLTRSGQIPPRTATELLARFRSQVGRDFYAWPVDSLIVTSAIPLVESFGLRSGDALHLATAASVFANFADSSRVFVSSDRELVQAARASGMAALDPQDQGAREALRSLRSAS